MTMAFMINIGCAEPRDSYLFQLAHPVMYSGIPFEILSIRHVFEHVHQQFCIEMVWWQSYRPNVVRIDKYFSMFMFHPLWVELSIST